MFRRFEYHILLHLIVFLWGFTGILGKLIELPALNIVWHRLLIATISLGIAMLFLKRSFRPASKKELLWFIFVGVLVSMHWFTFYLSIELSTASLGILCLSTTTLHVAWLEPLITKRPFSWMEIFFGVIVIYGIYFVSGNFDEKEYLALFYGLLSAVFAALFSIFNAQLVQNAPPSKISFYEFLTGLVFLSFVLLFMGKIDASLFKMSLSDFLWLLFLGVLCTSLAFLLNVEILKRLGAFTVTLSINMEPVYTILLAIVILNENEILGSQFYIGSLVIVLVVIANAVWKGYQRKKTKNPA